MHKYQQYQYNVTILSPLNEKTTEAYREMADVIAIALTELGCRVSKLDNFIAQDAINIAFAVNALVIRGLTELPENTIIYNLEQLSDASPWMTHTPAYFGLT